jgi:hypothetical protein
MSRRLAIQKCEKKLLLGRTNFCPTVALPNVFTLCCVVLCCIVLYYFPFAMRYFLLMLVLNNFVIDFYDEVYFFCSQNPKFSSFVAQTIILMVSQAQVSKYYLNYKDRKKNQVIFDKLKVQEEINRMQQEQINNSLQHDEALLNTIHIFEGRLTQLFEFVLALLPKPQDDDDTVA